MRSITCADGGAVAVLNCGYGHGYSVREVLGSVERVGGPPADGEGIAPPGRRSAGPGRARRPDPLARSAGSPGSTIWTPSCAPRSTGNGSSSTNPGNDAVSARRCMTAERPAAAQLQSGRHALAPTQVPERPDAARPGADRRAAARRAIVNAGLQIRALADTGQKLVEEGVSRRAREPGAVRPDRLARAHRAPLRRARASRSCSTSTASRTSGSPTTRAQLASAAARARPRARRSSQLGELQGTIRLSVLSTPRGARRSAASCRSASSELSALADAGRASRATRRSMRKSPRSKRRRSARDGGCAWQSALLLPLTLIAILGSRSRSAGRCARSTAPSASWAAARSRDPIAVSGPHDLERLGRPARVAAQPPARPRAGAQPLPAAHVARAEDAARQHPRRHGAADGRRRGRARHAINARSRAILRENGIKLQRLIENLLSFSAWQTYSIGLETSEFRLRPLVKQVLENQQLTLLSQRVRLDVKIEDVTLVADRGKLRLILENLLSNAVKYSPKGGAIHIERAPLGRESRARRRGQRPRHSAGRARAHFRCVLHRPRRRRARA